MSRLTEVLENHKQLDQLMAIMKHHGLNAAFLTTALLEALEQSQEEEEQAEDNKRQYEELYEDLQQFQSHF